MEFLSYLLKVSCCLTLFFAFYLLILRKLTFFKFNRFYLLVALLLSFVIPQLQFTIEREVVETVTAITPAVEINNDVVKEEIVPIYRYNSLPATSFNWYGLLFYGYGLVAFSMLLIAAFRLSKLLIYTGGNKQKINGLNVIVKNEGFTNCSFFNYVFIAKDKLSETELKVLVQHEMVHAQQLHSVDKLMMIVAKALLWFNPIIYLYDKALEDMHEYEADEVSSTNVGVTLYANLLLKLTIAKSNQLPIHHFVKSPIKKRIQMLFNHKSKNMKKLIYLLALPIGLGLIWGFTVDVVQVSVTSSTIVQDGPFIQRVNVPTNNGFKSEHITVNTVNGKPISLKTMYNHEKYQKPSIWVFVNDKLYSEAEALKFDKKFIQNLSENRGYAAAMDYDLPALNNEKYGYIFWFGNEPKLSVYTAKNRAYYKKYNGTTISGQIVDFSFNSNKLLDGFLVKTTNGETVKANVEIKFTKRIRAMIAKGDQVAIKIYNAGYWKDSEYPVLTSYKLMKDGKLLFDRWPKSANAATKVGDGSNFETQEAPKLLSSSKIRVDIKNGLTYVKMAKMQVYGGVLIADELTFDQQNKTIITTKASFSDKNGKVISGDAITFDYGRGTYIVKAPSGIINPTNKKTALVNVDPIEYTATDSVRKNKLTGEMFLYGNAAVSTNNMVYKGDKIVYDSKQQTLKVRDKANLYNKVTKTQTTADSLDMNLKTGKGIFSGVVIQNYKD